MSGMMLALHPDLGICTDGPGSPTVRILAGMYIFRARDRV
jgi:hypothetical protein